MGWPDESHFLLNHVGSWVHVCSLPGEHIRIGIHDLKKASLWKQWDALGIVRLIVLTE